jgi:hypothetical protein
MYVLEGRIRFRVGDDEFAAGPGTWVWQPRGVPHSFRVESEGARALVLFTPGGLERMFEEGGVPAAESRPNSAARSTTWRPLPRSHSATASRSSDRGSPDGVRYPRRRSGRRGRRSDAVAPPPEVASHRIQHPRRRGEIR